MQVGGKISSKVYLVEKYWNEKNTHVDITVVETNTNGKETKHAAINHKTTSSTRRSDRGSSQKIRKERSFMGQNTRNNVYHMIVSFSLD